MAIALVAIAMAVALLPYYQCLSKQPRTGRRKSGVGDARDDRIPKTLNPPPGTHASTTRAGEVKMIYYGFGHNTLAVVHISLADSGAPLRKRFVARDKLKVMQGPAPVHECSLCVCVWKRN